MKKFKNFLFQFAISSTEGFWKLSFLVFVLDFTAIFAGYTLNDNVYSCSIVWGLAIYYFIVALASIWKDIDELFQAKKVLNSIHEQYEEQIKDLKPGEKISLHFKIDKKLQDDDK